MSRHVVVFTDLDETLLERHTYSYAKAEPALALLREKDIPLVIVSSKTASEIEHYRRLMDNRHPFSSENGGGIFLPRGYFADTLQYNTEEHGEYDVIRLGTRYAGLREAIRELRAEGFETLRGFGDMTVQEVSALTGLKPEEAEMALQRHFDEPFTYDDGDDIERLEHAIRRKGLRLTQGRLYHLIGGNDKGKAVEILKELYCRKLGDITTVALGDSLTDMPMLKRVDHPIAVMKDDGGYDPRLDMPGIIKAGGVGPEGFSSSLLGLVPSLTED